MVTPQRLTVILSLLAESKRLGRPLQYYVNEGPYGVWYDTPPDHDFSVIDYEYRIRPEDMRPCPFCKKTDYLEINGTPMTACYVTCKNCHCKGPVALSREYAIKDWNSY